MADTIIDALRRSDVGAASRLLSEQGGAAFTDVSILEDVFPIALTNLAELYDKHGVTGEEGPYFDLARSLWLLMPEAEREIPDMLCTFFYAGCKFNQPDFVRWVLPIVATHPAISLPSCIADRMFELNQLRHSALYYVCKNGSVELYELLCDACGPGAPLAMEVKLYDRLVAPAISTGQRPPQCSAATIAMTSIPASAETAAAGGTDAVMKRPGEPDPPSLYMSLVGGHADFVRHVFSGLPPGLASRVIRCLTVHALIPLDDAAAAALLFQLGCERRRGVVVAPLRQPPPVVSHAGLVGEGGDGSVVASDPAVALSHTLGGTTIGGSHTPGGTTIGDTPPLIDYDALVWGLAMGAHSSTSTTSSSSHIAGSPSSSTAAATAAGGAKRGGDHRGSTASYATTQPAPSGFDSDRGLDGPGDLVAGASFSSANSTPIRTRSASSVATASDAAQLSSFAQQQPLQPLLLFISSGGGAGSSSSGGMQNLQFRSRYDSTSSVSSAATATLQQQLQLLLPPSPTPAATPPFHPPAHPSQHRRGSGSTSEVAAAAAAAAGGVISSSGGRGDRVGGPPSFFALHFCTFVHEHGADAHLVRWPPSVGYAAWLLSVLPAEQLLRPLPRMRWAGMLPLTSSVAATAAAAAAAATVPALFLGHFNDWTGGTRPQQTTPSTAASSAPLISSGADNATATYQTSGTSGSSSHSSVAFSGGSGGGISLLSGSGSGGGGVGSGSASVVCSMLWCGWTPFHSACAAGAVDVALLVSQRAPSLLCAPVYRVLPAPSTAFSASTMATASASSITPATSSAVHSGGGAPPPSTVMAVVFPIRIAVESSVWTRRHDLTAWLVVAAYGSGATDGSALQLLGHPPLQLQQQQQQQLSLAAQSAISDSFVGANNISGGGGGRSISSDGGAAVLVGAPTALGSSSTIEGAMSMPPPQESGFHTGTATRSHSGASPLSAALEPHLYAPVGRALFAARPEFVKALCKATPLSLRCMKTGGLGALGGGSISSATGGVAVGGGRQRRGSTNSSVEVMAGGGGGSLAQAGSHTKEISSSGGDSTLASSLVRVVDVTSNMGAASQAASSTGYDDAAAASASEAVGQSLPVGATPPSTPPRNRAAGNFVAGRGTGDLPTGTTGVSTSTLPPASLTFSISSSTGGPSQPLSLRHQHPFEASSSGPFEAPRNGQPLSHSLLPIMEVDSSGSLAPATSQRSARIRHGPLPSSATIATAAAGSALGTGGRGHAGSPSDSLFGGGEGAPTAGNAGGQSPVAAGGDGLGHFSWGGMVGDYRGRTRSEGTSAVSAAAASLLLYAPLEGGEGSETGDGGASDGNINALLSLPQRRRQQMQQRQQQHQRHQLQHNSALLPHAAALIVDVDVGGCSTSPTSPVNSDDDDDDDGDDDDLLNGSRVYDVDVGEDEDRGEEAGGPATTLLGSGAPALHTSATTSATSDASITTASLSPHQRIAATSSALHARVIPPSSSVAAAAAPTASDGDGFVVIARRPRRRAATSGSGTTKFMGMRLPPAATAAAAPGTSVASSAAVAAASASSAAATTPRGKHSKRGGGAPPAGAAVSLSASSSPLRGQTTSNVAQSLIRPPSHGQQQQHVQTHQPAQVSQARLSIASLPQSSPAPSSSGVSGPAAQHHPSRLQRQQQPQSVESRGTNSIVSFSDRAIPLLSTTSSSGTTGGAAHATHQRLEGYSSSTLLDGGGGGAGVETPHPLLLPSMLRHAAAASVQHDDHRQQGQLQPQPLQTQRRTTPPPARPIAFGVGSPLSRGTGGGADAPGGGNGGEGESEDILQGLVSRHSLGSADEGLGLFPFQMQQQRQQQGRPHGQISSTQPPALQQPRQGQTAQRAGYHHQHQHQPSQRRGSSSSSDYADDSSDAHPLQPVRLSYDADRDRRDSRAHKQRADEIEQLRQHQLLLQQHQQQLQQLLLQMAHYQSPAMAPQLHHLAISGSMLPRTLQEQYQLQQSQPPLLAPPEQQTAPPPVSSPHLNSHAVQFGIMSQRPSPPSSASPSAAAYSTVPSANRGGALLPSLGFQSPLVQATYNTSSEFSPTAPASIIPSASAQLPTGATYSAASASATPLDLTSARTRATPYSVVAASFSSSSSSPLAPRALATLLHPPPPPATATAARPYLGIEGARGCSVTAMPWGRGTAAWKEFDTRHHPLPPAYFECLAGLAELCDAPPTAASLAVATILPRELMRATGAGGGDDANRRVPLSFLGGNEGEGEDVVVAEGLRYVVRYLGDTAASALQEAPMQFAISTGGGAVSSAGRGVYYVVTELCEGGDIRTWRYATTPPTSSSSTFHRQAAGGGDSGGAATVTPLPAPPTPPTVIAAGREGGNSNEQRNRISDPLVSGRALTTMIPPAPSPPHLLRGIHTPVETPSTAASPPILNTSFLLARCRELLVGLAALHAVGMVHGGLTPGNVLLKRGRLKLSDVGLAPALLLAAAQEAEAASFHPLNDSTTTYSASSSSSSAPSSSSFVGGDWRSSPAWRAACERVVRLQGPWLPRESLLLLGALEGVEEEVEGGSGGEGSGEEGVGEGGGRGDSNGLSGRAVPTADSTAVGRSAVVATPHFLPWATETTTRPQTANAQSGSLSAAAAGGASAGAASDAYLPGAITPLLPPGDATGNVVASLSAPVALSIARDCTSTGAPPVSAAAPLPPPVSASPPSAVTLVGRIFTPGADVFAAGCLIFHMLTHARRHAFGPPALQLANILAGDGDDEYVGGGGKEGGVGVGGRGMQGRTGGGRGSSKHATRSRSSGNSSSDGSGGVPLLAQDLISRCTTSDLSARLTALEAVRHPLFWSPVRVQQCAADVALSGPNTLSSPSSRSSEM